MTIDRTMIQTPNARRRPTDARSPLEGMTPEEREMASLKRLASLVGFACDAFFLSRGLSSGASRTFKGEPRSIHTTIHQS